MKPTINYKNFKEFFEKNKELNSLYITLFSQRKCFMCSKKFKDGWFCKKEENKDFPIPKLRSDFLFHLFETHGISPENFIEFMENQKTIINNQNNE